MCESDEMSEWAKGQMKKPNTGVKLRIVEEGATNCWFD